MCGGCERFVVLRCVTKSFDYETLHDPPPLPPLFRLDSKTQTQYGFLTGRYDEDHYYWEVVIMGRKLGVLICMSFFSRSPIAQVGDAHGRIENRWEVCEWVFVTLMRLSWAHDLTASSWLFAAGWDGGGRPRCGRPFAAQVPSLRLRPSQPPRVCLHLVFGGGAGPGGPLQGPR